MLKLRKYQEECHRATMEYIKGKRSTPGINVLPTGSGKTVSIAKLADDYDRGKIVVLCPSQEILEQNFNKFKLYSDKGTIYSASFKSKEIGDITFATLGSVKKLGKTFKERGVTLLIQDECHQNSNASGGMLTKFLDDLSPLHYIGYTATPFRLKTYSDMGTGGSYSQINLLTRTRPKLFSNFIHITQISELVGEGYWAPVKIYNEPFNPLGLVLNSTGAEFTESSIARVSLNNNINNRIYKTAKGMLKNGVKSILLFLDSVDNCYKMSNALGDVSAVVEANTKSKDRKEIVDRFKNGELNVIVCVSTLTTGFDFPELQCVVMGRPTNSLSVFYQVYGRVVRPFKGKEGMFFDFGGNIDRFGSLETLTLEEHPTFGWGLFNGDNLLSGRPLDGTVITKKELLTIPSTKFRLSNKNVFEFGKHSGKKPDEVGAQYVQWAIKEVPHLMSKRLYEDCIEYLKKDPAG